MSLPAGQYSCPAGPPPLCSICQHKAPVFGKPPRRFSFRELELATGGFSGANFLAEGGFGSVHRGVLPDGQAVAVKQHKPASSQGDIEFCSEVEVLSCAQHRNVVMLIGYCVEDKKRLLVYEFICNGSLDSHLYAAQRDALAWNARQKVAIGAARGLRYLHEECRVGCIIHRDLRPNNILLTHDFEPMVGDFGLARWQPDGDLGVQTRVIGTFGYLAPEYAQSGEVTEKADLYSFGVVLLELATGRKAVDITRPKGQQCLTEWARPLLESGAVEELVDPRLEGRYTSHELLCTLHAASLCIQRDPQLRPRMSQVLRILEGDVVINEHTGGISNKHNVTLSSRNNKPQAPEADSSSAYVRDYKMAYDYKLGRSSSRIPAAAHPAAERFIIDTDYHIKGISQSRSHATTAAAAEANAAAGTNSSSLRSLLQQRQSCSQGSCKPDLHAKLSYEALRAVYQLTSPPPGLHHRQRRAGAAATPRDDDDDKGTYPYRSGSISNNTPGLSHPLHRFSFEYRQQLPDE